MGDIRGSHQEWRRRQQMPRMRKGAACGIKNYVGGVEEKLLLGGIRRLLLGNEHPEKYLMLTFRFHVEPCFVQIKPLKTQGAISWETLMIQRLR
jgi:hypothetical protein